MHAHLAQHTHYGQGLCHRDARTYARISRPVCRAYNHGTATAGACDPGIMTALEGCGDHSKAAYVLYSHFCVNKMKPTDIIGKHLREIVEEGGKNGNFPGLEGYTGVANIMGFPGRAGVFTVPTPITGMGMMKPAAKDKPSFLGYIAEGQGQDGTPELVIAFRGTVLGADWDTNLLGAVAAKGLYGDENGKVHRGFYNLIHGTPDDAAEDISPVKTIQAVLKRYMDSPASDLPRIITSGHSLGGALAILAAVFIAHALPGYRQDSADYTLRKLQTYTFAAPRIGDVELAEYLSSTLKYAAVQVKNKPDVVPYAPPAGFRDALKAVKKVIGMRPKRQPVARTGWFRTAAAEKLDDVPVDLELLERCEAYEELLDSLESEDPEDQINELEQSIAEARKLALERFKSSGIGVKKAASENTVGKVLYGADLLFTVSTKWCNNPAPPNGVCTLDVQKNDRWGQSHILEVYLDHLLAGDCNDE